MVVLSRRAAFEVWKLLMQQVSFSDDVIWLGRRRFYDNLTMVNNPRHDGQASLFSSIENSRSLMGGGY
jgi:hypothetical protein